jgi:S-layer protein (TIGR01567 family)
MRLPGAYGFDNLILQNDGTNSGKEGFKMRQLEKAALLAAILIISSVLSAAALDYVEVRSPVEKAINGTPVMWGSQKLWGGQEPLSKFSGFYYDVDDDLGTESLTVNINSEGVLEGSSNPYGIIYKSEAQEKAFKYKNWGDYLSIGFLGENYLAGYASTMEGEATPYLYEKSTDSNILGKEKILKVLQDDDTEGIFASGEKIRLKEGYELEISGVDIDGNTVHLNLLKNGQNVAEGLVVPSNEAQNIKDSTYCFVNDIGELKGLVTIALHFKNAYRAADREAVTVDGIFQISETPLSVAQGSRYNRMTVGSVTENSITLDNEDNSMILGMAMDKDIMDGIRLKTADQIVTEDDPLRFYIYKKITEPGTYEVRGEVKEAVESRDIHWDASNFPGFYYDLDNNLGTEFLSLNVVQGELDGDSQPRGVIYKTAASECDFKHKVWGKYYAIGFMGEKCFAGYIENASDPEGGSILWSASQDRNLMDDEVLARVLIDSDEEERPLGVGSVIPLQDGYEIHIIQIDTNGNKIAVRLSKDGRDVGDEKILDLKEESTYCYRKPLGTSGDDMVTIAVHFLNAFASGDANLVSYRGIWQLSDNLIPIAEKVKTDKMTIRHVNPTDGTMSIEMDNEDGTIILGSHRDLILMGDFYIKTADMSNAPPGSTMRLYVYRKETVGAETEETAAKEAIPPYEPAGPGANQELNNTGKEEAKKVPDFLAAIALVCILIIGCYRKLT